MRSLDHFAATKLDHLDGLALRRTLVDTGRGGFPYVTRDGQRLLSFSCNDYLGLSRHPEVKAAAARAIEDFGAGAGASRLVTGNHPLYAALEAKLATMKGTDAACVFGSGYLANVGVIGVLVARADLVLIDDLAHACLNAGASLSGATVMRFRHNDADHAGDLLAAHRHAHPHVLIVTETVFSMDGDRAPIAALATLAARHDAWLMTDDAHGTFQPDAIRAPLQVGTLSKAVGGYGGYLCASEPVVALMKTRARSLVYSTGLPPATIAGALAALTLIQERPDLATLPLARARSFTRELDLPEAQSPIVPLILGTPEAALAASAALARAGFLVTAIRPPTVPAGTARLRFAFSASHPEAEVLRLAATLRALGLARRLACPASS